MSGKITISLCTEMIFGGEPMHEILPAVKAAGYEAFEFWGWGNKDIDAVGRVVGETGLRVAAFATKHGNLVDAGERQNFIDGLKETIPVARRLGCRTLLATVGQRLDDRSDDEQTESIIAGLKEASPIVEDAGITIVLEPLNILVNHKGYFLDRSDTGFMIVGEVGSPNIKLLLDMHHQQKTESNITQNATENIGRIGHYNSAGVPGRHDLDIGEINYINVIKAIIGAGYSGYFGLEYSPVGERMESIRNALKMLPV